MCDNHDILLDAPWRFMKTKTSFDKSLKEVFLMSFDISQFLKDLIIEKIRCLQT